jgi:hypothetical protein
MTIVREGSLALNARRREAWTRDGRRLVAQGQQPPGLRDLMPFQPAEETVDCWESTLLGQTTKLGSI